ncbi:MAG: thioredoxin family protein [Chitinophagales bacterium]
MKNLFIFSMSIFLLFATACTETAESDKSSDKTKTKTMATSAAKGAIQWITLSELEQKIKKEPRKVMFDLYTGWCGWCKRMDRDTFQNPEVASYINENFYAVKFDAETSTTVNFNGNAYEFVPGRRRGTNMLATRLILGEKSTGRVGYPTIAFLDENLNRIDAFPGYKNAHNFDELAHFVKEEQYKAGKSLAQFQQSFNSEIPDNKPAPKRARTPQPNIKVQPKTTN